MVSIFEEKIQQAYETILGGGLAIIPSRVGYTLLGNSQQAIEKMYRIKGRPLTKPCVVLTRYDVLPEISQIPERHQPFVDAIESAGMLCGFILRRKEHPYFASLSSYTDSNAQKPDGTSCYVIHGGAYIQYLVDRALADGTFVVGSSANQSGTGNEGMFSKIPESIRDEVDFAIDHDAFVHQEYDPRTRAQGVMVDLTGDTAVIIRKGLQDATIAVLVQEHNLLLGD